MDLDKIAQAFAAGFTVGRAMAMDAARDGEEDGHWVTVGAEAGPDGEKHGGRPVFIHGSDTYRGAGAAKRRTEAKRESRQNKVKKSRRSDFNLPMGAFMTQTKFGSGTFADAWQDRVRDSADTFKSLTDNLSADGQYLLKHALAVVKYKPFERSSGSSEADAFYSFKHGTVNFPESYFQNKSQRRGKPAFMTIMHELGHAVDHVAGTKADGHQITSNDTLTSAIVTDTYRLVKEQRAAVRKKLDTNEREKDRLLKKYVAQNPDAKRPTPGELIDFGVSEELREWTNRPDGGWYGALFGVSDMVSAVTLNKIRDGGVHETKYWKSGKYMMNTEFIAHYFETCTDREIKETFAQVFPTATKVLEILIKDTADNLRQKEKTK